MEKVKVWYSIQNGGDGSAYPNWWLSEKEAEWEQDNMDEGWGEPCTGSVETFVGSNIYTEALKEREKNQKVLKAKKEGIKLPKGEYDDNFKNIELSEEDKQDLSFLEIAPIDSWNLNC